MADDTLEQAALAFDASMNPAPKPAARGKAAAADAPSESVFDNLGAMEVDDDSPPRGGGDDAEDAIYGEEPEARTRNARKKDGERSEGDDDGDADAEDRTDDEDDGTGEARAEEEEDEEGADDLLGQTVEVTVDGEPVEVTVKEALEGYVRTQTFHQRMNQLDEARKVVRRAAADAVQNYEYSMIVAKQIEAHMEAMVPKEPDWDAEFAKDPVKARDLQKYFTQANQFKASLKEQLEEARKKMDESAAVQTQAFAEEESLKFEAANRKNWADPKKKAKDLASMRKTGLSSGFTEEELSQVYDSRMLQVLLKASKYDRMMAAKPKAIVPKPKGRPIAPGTGSARQRTVRKGDDVAMKRLNRSGSIEDAAAVFTNIIAREG